MPEQMHFCKIVLVELIPQQPEGEGPAPAFTLGQIESLLVPVRGEVVATTED